MKNPLFLLCLLLVLFFGSANASGGEKIKQSFETLFPKATNVQWSETNETIEASFELDEIKCRIRYTPDGKVHSTIRYYGEKQLTPFLKSKVAQRFPEQKIFGVTEVTSDEEFLYVIVLHDEKQWTHLHVSPTGQMTVENKYRRADP